MISLEENTKPEGELSEQEAMEQFISNEDNRQKALALADQIQQVVGKNWFTLDRLVKKSGESRLSAFQKLQLCKMFGVVEQKIGSWRDGKDNVRQPLFKVTIAKEDRIKALHQIIEYHKDQIEQIELQLKNLNS